MRAAVLIVRIHLPPAERQQTFGSARDSARRLRDIGVARDPASDKDAVGNRGIVIAGQGHDRQPSRGEQPGGALGSSAPPTTRRLWSQRSTSKSGDTRIATISAWRRCAARGRARRAGRWRWRTAITSRPRRAANPLRPSWVFGDEEIAATAADYLALGHWDRPMQVGSGVVPAYYSGSPELAGTVNLVRLNAAGEVVVAREKLLADL
jgi:hypothetical protein